MRFSFKKRLSSLASPILRVFRMSDTPNGTEFRPNELNVAIYLELLRLNYTNTAESKELLVVSVSLYKQQSASQHEYLVFKVKNRSGAHYYFRVERMPDLGVLESAAPSPTSSSLSLSEAPPSPSPSSTPSLLAPEPPHSSQLAPRPLLSKKKGSVASFNSSLADQTAKDTIQWVQEPKKVSSDCLLGVLTFTAQSASLALYLYHIVILAATFHKSHERYQLLSHNCYHLSGVMMKVLESAYESRMVKEMDIPPLLQKGSWFIIGRTFNPEEKEHTNDIKKLIVKFDAAVKEFEQVLVTKEEKKREEEESKKEVRAKEREIAAAKKDSEAAKKDSEVAKKDSEAAKKDSEVAKKDSEAAKKESEAAKKESEAAKKESEAAKKESEAAKKESEAAKKESEAAKKESEAAKKESEAAKKESEAAKKESEAAKKESEAAKEAARAKDREIELMKEMIERLQAEVGLGKKDKALSQA